MPKQPSPIRKPKEEKKPDTPPPVEKKEDPKKKKPEMKDAWTQTDKSATAEYKAKLMREKERQQRAAREANDQ